MNVVKMNTKSLSARYANRAIKRGKMEKMGKAERGQTREIRDTRMH
jgi:hypothetical protein